ncbi:Acyl-CoA dehydrogenase [Micromonospora nigra]|uniref:Acyl-CoA dehydrogenase n=1 Tax=Micromonospora nigra TaxID=145857 RepID=A0A1C6T1H7_9ACTN|nr:acyl-CoA dehydrogenase family protein [Micromonospora nigra]SCL35684.1 Acyl-CoA dehydrogenase [Micromonospora nigra]
MTQATTFDRVPDTTDAQEPALLAAARALAPEIEERATELESEGTLPVDLVTRIRDAGLFSMALPPALGGPGADLRTIVSVVEEISRANGSAGWTVLIGQGSGFLGWVDPDVGRQIVEAVPHPVMAGSLAPTGWGTVADPDSYVLSGRWSFNSGCWHADFVQVAFFVRDGDGPRLGPSGQPVMRFALLPAREAEILTTWDTMGLRGTGSDDLLISDAVVRHDWTLDPIFEPARHDGPLYRLSHFSYLMTLMAGFPLGVARRALDEFRDLAERESPPGTRHPLAHDPMVQARLLRATTALRAARLLVFDALDQVWDEARGGAVEPRTRACLAAAVQHAQRTAEEVVQWAFQTCGEPALYASHPLQRCWRDITAAGQHIAFGADTERRTSRTVFGLEREQLHLV